MHLFADVRLARWSLRHQPSRQVDRVAEAGERPAHRMAVRAAAQAAVGDADLQIGRGRFLFEREQLDGRRAARVASSSCACGVPNTPQRYAPLSPRMSVQKVAAEIREDALRASNEVIELRAASGSLS